MSKTLQVGQTIYSQAYTQRGYYTHKVKEVRKKYVAISNYMNPEIQLSEINGLKQTNSVYAPFFLTISELKQAIEKDRLRRDLSCKLNFSSSGDLSLSQLQRISEIINEKQ